MPRVARIVLPGLPHHLTHRGNRRSAIFFSKNDRQRYLAFLLEYSARHQLDLWAYCLMTNHIHLLAVPRRVDSLDRAVGRAHMMYARWINTRRGWTGHLWGNRFYSCPVEPDRAQVVARYVELNPVRAGMVVRPEDHLWSSARAHCQGIDDPLLAGNCPFEGSAWKEWLGEVIEESEAPAIRRAVTTGSPFGSSEFLERLEECLGRRLRRRAYRSHDDESQ